MIYDHKTPRKQRRLRTAYNAERRSARVKSSHLKYKCMRVVLHHPGWDDAIVNGWLGQPSVARHSK